MVINLSDFLVTQRNIAHPDTGSHKRRDFPDRTHGHLSVLHQYVTNTFELQYTAFFNIQFAEQHINALV